MSSRRSDGTQVRHGGQLRLLRLHRKQHLVPLLLLLEALPAMPMAPVCAQMHRVAQRLATPITERVRPHARSCASCHAARRWPLGRGALH